MDTERLLQKKYSADDFINIMGVTVDEETKQIKVNHIFCRNCSSLKCDRCHYKSFVEACKLFETLNDNTGECDAETADDLWKYLLKEIEADDGYADHFVWLALKCCDDIELEKCVIRLNCYL